MLDVRMPVLSDSMREGTIARWLKSAGDVVTRGEEIVEIETDKATMGYEAEGDGVLEILAADGETRAVGDVIGRIVPVGARAAVDAPPPVRPDELGSSPVARRLAKQLGVGLEEIRGTGPGGRVTKADVLRFERAAAPAPAAPAAEPRERGSIVAEELTRVQETVARRMEESHASIPDFWVSIDVDMTAALELRKQFQRAFDDPPSVNDLLIKACALTLRRHPRINGAYRDGRFERYERVNVGMAVAVDDGLFVPTIFDADRQPLTAIAAETRRVAERVRRGEITPPELAGGTFTVSNLGMFGVSRFGGVINAPEAAILCVGAAEPRAYVDPSGAAVMRPTMTLTLVSDHRIVYGADAARFLSDLRELLVAPLAMVVP